jgi:hypothetical protein
MKKEKKNKKNSSVRYGVLHIPENPMLKHDKTTLEYQQIQDIIALSALEEYFKDIP